MKVSIIIPTLNEEGYLPKLLECLKTQSFQDFEVLVADAGSVDKTVQIAKEFGAQVVSGGIPGVGRNSGAKHARGEILIFIDADVTFNATFLSESIHEFQTKQYDLAVPLFITEVEKLRYRILLNMINGYKNFMKHTPFPDGTGQLVLIKRQAFEALGGFRDWEVAEDTDLFWRGAAKKYQIGVLSTQFVTSTRRYEKFGIYWIFTIWAFIGLFMILGIYKYKFPRVHLEKLYGEWGKWGRKAY